MKLKIKEGQKMDDEGKISKGYILPNVHKITDLPINKALLKGQCRYFDQGVQR